MRKQKQMETAVSSSVAESSTVSSQIDAIGAPASSGGEGTVGARVLGGGGGGDGLGAGPKAAGSHGLHSTTSV